MRDEVISLKYISFSMNKTNKISKCQVGIVEAIIDATPTIDFEGELKRNRNKNMFLKFSKFTDAMRVNTFICQKQVNLIV